MAGMMDGFTTGYMPTEQLRAKGPPSPAMFPAALPPQSLTGTPPAVPGIQPARPAQGVQPAAGTLPIEIQANPGAPLMTTSPIGPHERAAPIPQAYQPVAAPMDDQRNAIAASLQANGHPADVQPMAPPPQQPTVSLLPTAPATTQPVQPRLRPTNVRHYSPGPTIGSRRGWGMR